MKHLITTAAITALGVAALVACSKPKPAPEEPAPPPATAAQKAEADRAVFSKLSEWKQLRSQAITCDQETERELNAWKANNSTWDEDRGIWITKTLDQLPTHERCIKAHIAKDIALGELADLHHSLEKQGKVRPFSYYMGPVDQ